MIHRFHYPTFRQHYMHAKHMQRLRSIAEERTRALITSVVRPTEFHAELAIRLASGRLTLTPLEKRVLHYDKQYLRSTPENVRSDYVTQERARYIGARAGCPSSQVTRTLENIEWLFWSASVLDVEMDTHYVRCARRRTRQKSAAKV